MTARITASGMQNCLHAAIVALVERIGTAAAASEIGCDPATIRRHKAAGGWSDVEISALVAYEMQEGAHSTILDALVHHTHGQTTAQRGESLRLRADLIQELDDDAQVDRAILKNLDHSTPAGRREIRDRLAARREHEQTLLADLDAQDRTHGSDRT